MWLVTAINSEVQRFFELHVSRSGSVYSAVILLLSHNFFWPEARHCRGTEVEPPCNKAGVQIWAKVPRHVFLSCHVLSCHVMSCPVLSCPVLYLVLSCVSGLVLSLTCPVVPCRVPSLNFNEKERKRQRAREPESDVELVSQRPTAHRCESPQCCTLDGYHQPTLHTEISQNSAAKWDTVAVNSWARLNTLRLVPLHPSAEAFYR